MGVKGLWRLIKSCGTPVPLESLENKILAVDVSIWLHQAVRGFRGFGSGTVANAHLLSLFHRICKLLFYRIRPVFVFDGGVPQLKRQTLSSRRLRREAAAGKAQKVRDRLLSNLLRSQAVRKALGKKGPGPNLHHISKPIKKEKDLFELPPLSKPLTNKGERHSKTGSDSENEEDYIYRNLNRENLHNFQYESSDFQSLPLEAQHEILSELQVTRKENSWNTINEMPQESNNFSSFQMERLLRRNNFQKKLDDIRSEIRKVNTSEIEAQLFGDLEKHVSFTHKIVSEDAAHSILVKNVKENVSKNIGTINNSIREQDSSKVKSSLKQDFLTELSKHGIVSTSKPGMKRDFDCSLSQSSDEGSFSDFSDEESYMAPKKKKKLEETAFIKALDYVLDDSELTQEEILSLIQQTQKEVDTESFPNRTNNKSNVCKDDLNVNNPSTSANASGIVYNSDAESSSTDDGDFIDVTDTETEIPESYKSSINDSVGDLSRNNTNNTTESKTGSNVNKVLEAKTDSLYLKIIQQKLGDIVQHSSVKTKVDTRKFRKDNSFSNPNESPNKEGISNINAVLEVSPKKNIPIFLELNKQKLPIPDKDDIFTDIFKGSNEVKLKYKKRSLDNEMCQPQLNNNTTYDFLEANKPAINLSDIQLTSELKNKVSELVEAEVSNIISKVDKLSGITSNTSEVIKISKDSSSKTIDESFANNINETSKNPLNENSKNDSLLIKSINSSNTSVKQTNSVVVLETLQNFVEKLDTSEILPVNNIDSSEVNSIRNENVTLDIKNYKEIKEAEISKSQLNEALDDKIENMDKIQTEITPKYSEVELEHIESELAKEQNNLIARVNDAERIAVDISDQVYGEAQELLQVFGLPYIVAPMEAEAQCAFLDEEGLTHGTITNDSDIFLFGGKKVYKNFFDQGKYVECFKIENIKHNLGLQRNKMITLALLTGSDYTIGIESVGSVLGMEILAEFPGKGIECLKNLKKWWNVASKNVSFTQPSKTKQRLSQLHISDSFPNENIYNAYLKPDIDDSKEKFSWGIPNIENVRSFASEKFGWNELKTNEIILPVLKKLGLKETQMRIDSYFNNIKLVKEPYLKSKRLEEAIAKSKEDGVNVDNQQTKYNSINKEEPKTMKKTLLIDPSKGNYGVSSKKKRGRKKTSSKKEKNYYIHETLPNCDLEGKELQSDSEETEDASLSKDEKKSLIYKKLLDKEKILQAEKEKKDKEMRKFLAAKVLSKTKVQNNKRKR